MDIQAFKRKVRLCYFHKLEVDDGNISSEGEEIIELSEPWKPKSKFDPPKTDNPDLELFLDIMEKELLNPKKEKKIQDNLKDTERTALYSLPKYNKDIRSKTLMRTQDKGSRLVMECKERYITEMFSYLNNKRTFREDELDQSETYQQKVKDWTKSWEHKLTKGEVEWINKKEVTSGKVYANVKTHKENNPYRYIVSARGTAIENLARWIEYRLKELSRQHPAYLEDTRHFLSYIDGVNKEIGPFNKEKLWFISRDIVNYYPSCGTEMCLKAVGQLLDTCKENIPEKQCILDALAITMTSNSCNFMGKYFTQVDGATIGGPESASVTDIYGAVFIDSKIEENIINENEDWKRYRDDSFSISLQTSKEREIEKTEWMNNNIVKDKIKFTMECSQDEMIFLDT